MLLDIRPKIDKEDLYGREAELEDMLSSLRSNTPLILLLGQRRIGKTSLLKTSLNELGGPWLYLDVRRLDEEGYSKVILYRLLSEEITRLNSSWERLGEALKRVKGIQVAGSGIELDWSQKGPLLSSLFHFLNDWVAKSKAGKTGTGKDLIVAIDEAQLLINMTGGKGKIDFRSLIAYCYDNLRHIKFVLTGSEIGLLMDFVGSDDAKSPLYGRGKTEITLERFERQKSLGYLTAGFKECKVKVEHGTLEKAVEKLDGIVGWLTLYGNLAASQEKQGRLDESQIMESVMELAKGTASNELQSILRRSKYYGMALRSMSMGRTHWKDIKIDVASRLGRPATDSQLSKTLATLTKLSIVDKNGAEYNIPDPVIAEYAKSL